jgi:hypothetical protein
MFTSLFIGIGARGTRLTYEKVLGDQSVRLKDIKKNDYVKLPAGIHRFPFAFVVPNVSWASFFFFLLWCILN